mmetsp:Transcript_24715/g.18704  ORF Transcript_24715/g.18704 Transcript_24715/m.18704 type:complete len:104 (+) Transcript_24715:263-574(+)|eukprot:CAMPEP_0202974814 /NCGR_PEP_ID=MMETSP1396-20130829/64190_1 /ASSEMBLY_ACC=CAM_ASM_000872 /TAXON_ID= /ORGANISM="Pseudokeronopsis sp., Strain Brazil" /LENGTH=103 /DNA_ID=CAMNT_0049709383 /DNA_START=793 /DNA_END=1104 /DNA_ORIENTATION=+
MQLHPSLVLNNFTFRGDLEGRDVFYAVCSGFREKPGACKKKAFDEKMEDGILHVVTPDGKSVDDQVRNSQLIIAIILVALVNLGCLAVFRYFHKQRQSEVMRL